MALHLQLYLSVFSDSIFLNCSSNYDTSIKRKKRLFFSFLYFSSSKTGQVSSASFLRPFFLDFGSSTSWRSIAFFLFFGVARLSPKSLLSLRLFPFFPHAGGTRSPKERSVVEPGMTPVVLGLPPVRIGSTLVTPVHLPTVVHNCSLVTQGLGHLVVLVRRHVHPLGLVVSGLILVPVVLMVHLLRRPSLKGMSVIRHFCRSLFSVRCSFAVRSLFAVGDRSGGDYICWV